MMSRKNLSTTFLLAGAISILIMSLHYYDGNPSGIFKGKAIKDMLWYRCCFMIHITGGLVAICLGPLQFAPSLLRIIKFHRAMGYVYSLSVSLGGLTGLVIAQQAIGGLPSRLGFSALSVSWLFSLYMGVSSILKQDVKSHHFWMKINYALTFSSITQRTMLLGAFLPSVSFITVYRYSAWLSWIFNITVVLFLHYQKHRHENLYHSQQLADNHSIGKIDTSLTNS